MENKTLIEFATVYTKLDNLSKKVLGKINPTSISEGVIISSLLSRKLYPKHDYKSIINLCKKYKINYSSLERAYEKYLATEKEVTKLKDKLEQIGLKNISVGPFSVYGEKGEITTLIEIDPSKKKLNLSVFNGEENDDAKNIREIKKLREKVESILD